MAKPDFLVIGAQKAGTTWLYRNLQNHPEVWLPPIKEIHYFDRRMQPLILDALGHRRQRSMLWRWLRPGLQNVARDPQSLKWHARFFLQPRSDTWYQSCFAGIDGVLNGDITPAYARLGDQSVENVARLLPQAKVIYILRDPVERLWSQAAMYFSRYGYASLEDQSDAEIERFLAWDLARANGTYIANIDRWRAHFPPQQVHIAFFDQLVSDPQAFLTEMCGFLGVSPPEPDKSLTQKIHARSYHAIPDHHQAKLSSEYLPELRALDRRFGNAHTGSWLKRAQLSVG